MRAVQLDAQSLIDGIGYFIDSPWSTERIRVHSLVDFLDSLILYDCILYDGALHDKKKEELNNTIESFLKIVPFDLRDSFERKIQPNNFRKNELDDVVKSAGHALKEHLAHLSNQAVSGKEFLARYKKGKLDRFSSIMIEYVAKKKMPDSEKVDEIIKSVNTGGRFYRQMLSNHELFDEVVYLYERKLVDDDIFELYFFAFRILFYNFSIKKINELLIGDDEGKSSLVTYNPLLERKDAIKNFCPGLLKDCTENILEKMYHAVQRAYCNMGDDLGVVLESDYMPQLGGIILGNGKCKSKENLLYDVQSWTGQDLREKIWNNAKEFSVAQKNGKEQIVKDTIDILTLQNRKLKFKVTEIIDATVNALVSNGLSLIPLAVKLAYIDIKSKRIPFYSHFINLSRTLPAVDLVEQDVKRIFNINLEKNR
jgi:hypothetical protein